MLRASRAAEETPGERPATSAVARRDIVGHFRGEGRGVADAKRLGVTRGLEALRRDNPWPELPDVAPFYLSLDGGGRELVSKLLQQPGIELMVEIGCFLCGSTIQWLDANPSLTVIGIDPWDGNFGPHIRMRAAEGNRAMDTLEDPVATAEAVERYGNFVIAVNNVRGYRERFIPVRQLSPDALHYLKRRDITPDVVYIDAFKHEDDLYVADDLWPGAILCGDDWNWKDADGRLIMRENVERFAKERGFAVEADRATWVLHRRSR
jgi:hypothetical protein